MEINKIEQDMMTALDDWNVDYDPYAIEKIANVWNDQKSDLRNILSRHPLWREDEQAIVFNYTQTREFDENNYKEELNRFYNVSIHLINPSSTGLFDAVYYAFYYNVDGKLANQNLIDKLSNLTTETFTVGTKCSRIFNKLMLPFFEGDTHTLEEYNHYFARVADSMNPVQIKKYTCLSIHPADFLNMSNGTNWRSCHSMNGGGWQSGCLSYLLDRYSMILYTVSSKFDEEQGNFWRENKIDRQIYCLDQYNRLLQSRLYPQDNETNHAQSDEFRHLVQGILSECLNIPNLWRKLSDDSNEHFVKFSSATLYPDWEYNDYYTNVSIPKGTDVLGISQTEIGRTPMCLLCGEEFDPNDTDELYCDSCDSELFCTRCGAVHDKEDMFLIDGDWYCEDCVFYCKYHEEYETVTDWLGEVDGYGVICYSAYESGDFYYCNDCGNLIYIDDICRTNDGSVICPSCAEDYYRYCDNCDVYFRDNQYHACPDCGAVVN